MNKKQLTARAEELKIIIAKGATNDVISDLIKIAEHPILSIKVVELENEILKKNGVINDLESSLNEEKEKSKLTEVNTVEEGDAVVYKTDKVSFYFTTPSFRFQGEKYLASEAVEYEDLMKKLIKSGSTILKTL